MRDFVRGVGFFIVCVMSAVAGGIFVHDLERPTCIGMPPVADAIVRQTGTTAGGGAA